MNGPVRVAVLMGGRSAEREVSLNTGAQVSEALRTAGFEVATVDTGSIDALAGLMRMKADCAFICLHGRFGEDGTIQGLLELLGMPYVGSGVLASALAMDKAMCKRVLESEGIPTPDHVALERGVPVDTGTIAARCGGKCVVKPSCEGSSVGMTIVHEPAELLPAITEAFRHDGTVLVERFIAGVEVTVGVLGNDEPVALPTLEIVPEHEFYDYDSKYVPGMSAHIIPARVSEAARAECARLALACHASLGCRGMSRTDTIVDDTDRVWVLEVNTIPGMTATSLYPDAARAAGMDFPDLTRRLVTLALEDAGAGR